MDGVDDVGHGIRRITFPLPFGISHVHCYLVPGEDGWMLVDTAIATPGATERWQAVLAELGEPVARIFVTHFHPDHVGGAAVVAGLTGAPVLQGRLDYAYCKGAWGNPAAGPASAAQLTSQGMPQLEADAVLAHHVRLVSAVRFARDPILVEPGDEIAGWKVLHLPGHADGHLALSRDGVLLAGDALLGEISPNIGVYPQSVPDPLGEYLGSLQRISKLAPELTLPGHGPPIIDAVGRARELAEHHRERLGFAAGLLDGRPQSPYAVSLGLFPGEFPPALRRMAVAETVAHLEHLVLRGQIARSESAGMVAYAAST